MSLLHDVLFRWKCTSTHHKLAVDALRHLPGEKAEAWRNVFLCRIESYLQGAKAPDDKFKDFRNHVLHVSGTEWGGVIGAAGEWYDTSLKALQEKRWNDFVYSAGVLSHYVTDPWQPFHTGQTEAEGIVHRPGEWSIACRYVTLSEELDKIPGGYGEMSPPIRRADLADAIRKAARTAHLQYDYLIDHYKLEIGKKKPVEGYDAPAWERIRTLVAAAVRDWTRTLGGLFEEGGVEPPSSPLAGVYGAMTAATVPLFAVTQNRFQAGERKVVAKIAREYEATGKVIKALPPDEAAVRKLHAEEVLKVDMSTLDAEAPRPVGTAYVPPTPAAKPVAEKKTPEKKAVEKKVQEKKVLEKEAPKAAPEPVAQSSETPAANPTPAKVETPKATPAPQPVAAAPMTPAAPKPAPAAPKPADSPFRLHLESPLVDAPSIGEKTAARFADIGVHTVGDFIKTSADKMTRQLAVKHLDAATLRDWQHQATLCCRVPHLRGHDAQLLTLIGLTDPDQLANQDAETVLELVNEAVNTPEGDSILRGGQPPDLDEVRDWITWSSQSRPLRGAAAA